MPDSISPAAARRIALAAQGFGAPSSVGAGTRRLNRTIENLGLLQLDSVTVFERSHYLPLFARLGAYDRAVLDRLTFARGGRYIEYWAHQAAIIPLSSWPLFRWRMDDLRAKYGAGAAGWVQSNAQMIEWLLAELAEKGPLAASEIEHEAAKGSGGWWGWSDVKQGLEYLFLFGDVVTAGRTRFERTYGLASELLPDDIREQRMPRQDAIRELMRISARAHGIGTLSDLADYFRLLQAPAKSALLDLVDSGEVLEVCVPGWNRPAYLHRDARIPRRIEAVAMLSPFDPVVWERDRDERMFGFHYRIEIYTPAAKRVFGYYSLPILLDDRIVGRIDLKSDRQDGVLRVQSAWSEEGAPAETAARLAPLLRETAAWQGLSEVAVADRGTLAAPIASELGVRVRAAGTT